MDVYIKAVKFSKAECLHFRCNASRFKKKKRIQFVKTEKKKNCTDVEVWKEERISLLLCSRL